MAVLADRSILAALKANLLVIEPFNPQHLSNSSYDVTLGSHYYRANPDVKVVNPWCEQHSRAFWGEPQTASSATADDAKNLGLEVGDLYIRLAPGEMILGHTDEFIGGRASHTTMMKARSSIGRSCLSVCKCAGMGDIGYISRWTMEIGNHSPTATLILPVGKRIAQIVFLPTEEPLTPYQGNYQSSSDLAQIKTQWSPQEMLPKLYREKAPGAS